MVVPSQTSSRDSSAQSLGALFSKLASFAAPYLQENRILKMHLGARGGAEPNQLLPHRLTGREAINEGLAYDLEVLSSDAYLELKAILGLPIEVTILTDQGTERRLCGVVTAVSQLGSDGGFSVYQLKIESGLAALRHRRTSRVFTDTNVKDLTMKVLQEHLGQNAVLGGCMRIEDRCRATYPQRPFWMQYGEDDERFLKRLWAREGISFVVVPSGESNTDHPQHTLILFDDAMDLDENPCLEARFHRSDATEQRDAINEWRARRTLQTSSVSRASWNHESASMTEPGERSAIDQGPHGNALAETFEDYRHHRSLEDSETGTVEGRTRTRMQALDAATKHFEGEGTMRDFQAGTWFKLTQHPVHDQDEDTQREFVITALETKAFNNLPKDFMERMGELLGSALQAGAGQGSNQGMLGSLLEAATKSGAPELPCTNRFTCIRRGIPLLPEAIPAPRPGLLSARVVGPEGEEIHVDELGRIKVRFTFTRPQEHPESGASETDADSAWVRLAQMWSSQGFGSSFIPRVGDEVLIQFVGSDPDKPVVAGCISNGVKVPTAFSKVSSLPADKALSGIRSKMVHGVGGNELVFDDTTDELRLRLASDHLASQLNMGFLVKPRRGLPSDPLGEGFELKTEGWGAVRTAKGLMLTTDGGLDDQLEDAPLTSQLQSSIDLAKTLSDVSEKHKAEGLETIETVKTTKTILENTKFLGHDDKAKRVVAFSDPVIALSSPGGIVSATPSEQAIHASNIFHVTAGQDINIGVGGRLVMAVKEAWSVFVAKAGIKILAGKKNIELRAHVTDLNATADQSLKLIAINGKLDLLAKESITLATPGAKVQLKNGEINIEGSMCTLYSAWLKQITPMKLDPPLPVLPKGDATICVECMQRAAKRGAPFIATS